MHQHASPVFTVRSPMIGSQCLFSIGSQEIHALGPSKRIKCWFQIPSMLGWGHVPIGPFFDFKSQLHNPRFCDGSAEGHHGSSWDSPHRGCLHHMLPIPETLGTGLGGCEIHWPQWPPYKATPNDMMWCFGSKEIWDSSSASPIKPLAETQDVPLQSPWFPCLLAMSQHRNKTSRFEKSVFWKNSQPSQKYNKIQQDCTNQMYWNVFNMLPFTLSCIQGLWSISASIHLHPSHNLAVPQWWPHPLLQSCRHLASKCRASLFHMSHVDEIGP